MDAPPLPPSPPPSSRAALALAGAGLLLVVALTLLFAKLPPQYRVWNLSAVGAVALFAASRLGFVGGLVFAAVALALKDLCLYLTTPWWEPYPLSWAYFAGYVLAGWLLLRRSASVGRAAGVGFGCGLIFFVVSNFVSWLEMALPYDRSLAGLLDSYVAAIPFYRGTFLGDTFLTAALFAAYPLLARAPVPQENHW
jgi:hypothetical protein